MNKRIWNEEELKAMPHWGVDEYGHWYCSNEFVVLNHAMIGCEITDEFEERWEIRNYMIAITEDIPQTHASEMETKSIVYIKNKNNNELTQYVGFAYTKIYSVYGYLGIDGNDVVFFYCDEERGIVKDILYNYEIIKE